MPGLSKEAALILGGLAALVNGIVTVAGLGAFEDGLQWADLVPILAPLMASLGIRESVYSKFTVEHLAEFKARRAERRGEAGAGTEYRKPR